MESQSPHPNQMDPAVWGPHYWFVLHTIAYTYPAKPNDVTKKKFYEFILNLPIFLPHDGISKSFAGLLEKYPVSSYLDDRESFIRYMNFIHNKVNQLMGKEEQSLRESLEKYYKEFVPKEIKMQESLRQYKSAVFLAIILLLLFLIYVYY